MFKNSLSEKKKNKKNVNENDNVTPKYCTPTSKGKINKTKNDKKIVCV